MDDRLQEVQLLMLRLQVRHEVLQAVHIPL
jgi:hypothetical protein